MYGPFVQTPEQAVALGLNKFFDGAACKNGHISPKYVLRTKCVECTQDASRRRDDKIKRQYACYRGNEPLSKRIFDGSMTIPESGCWIWMRALTRSGYGQLTYLNRHMEAHRASWITHRGEIPDGLGVLHRCNIRSCVNPDHLYLGGQKENVADAIAAGTFRSPPRRLGSFHPLSKLNEGQARKIKYGTEPAVVVADSFGVKVQTVYAIRSGRQWKHV